MSKSFIRFHNLSFCWPSQIEPLFTGVNLTIETGWTGLVGRNGCGKSTFLSLISGDLKPDEGSVDHSLNTVLCKQRTDRPPGDLEVFASRPDGLSGRLAASLGIFSNQQPISGGR